MTLGEWVSQHRDQVRQEAAAKAPLGILLALAEREITDGQAVPSYDGRLQHAHAAILAVADAALLAAGYRLRAGTPAHHYLLLESLHHTLGLTPEQVNTLQQYRRKRVRITYQQVGAVTATEARAALDTARQLIDTLRDWLGAAHPDLL